MFSFISKVFNANATRELTELNRYKIKEQEEKYLYHALNVIKEAAEYGSSSLYIKKTENEDDYAVFSCSYVQINLVELGYNIKCRQGLITVRW